MNVSIVLSGVGLMLGAVFIRRRALKEKDPDSGFVLSLRIGPLISAWMLFLAGAAIVVDSIARWLW